MLELPFSARRHGASIGKSIWDLLQPEKDHDELNFDHATLAHSNQSLRT